MNWKNPKILIPLVLVVVVVAFLLLRGRGASFPSLSLENSPYTTLTPRSDGHWLKLTIENFNLPGAATLDYELIYQVPEGTTQGVPGKVEIGKEDKVERDLLLGSESAGKFRYDEGVTDGELNLTFKNSSGKILAELSTPWKLVKGESEIAISGFSYAIQNSNEDEYLVAMETFGLPKALESASGTAFGVFASGGEPYAGSVNLSEKLFRWDGVDWREMESSESPNIGVFVSVK